MYKNQLQELAQRSCFNLPSYSCIREGPDHAPRFKATVNFNGEVFESPGYFSTLRQAEHAAAEVALNTLSKRGPTQSLAARILDETGVCKNLLQETAQRAGVSLPVYTTTRTGPKHVPVFKCMVEVGGRAFCGEPAKTKKQAEKNAAMAAWSALKQWNPSSTPLLLGSCEAIDEIDRSNQSNALTVYRRDDRAGFSSNASAVHPPGYTGRSRVKVVNVRDRNRRSREGSPAAQFYPGPSVSADPQYEQHRSRYFVSQQAGSSSLQGDMNYETVQGTHGGYHTYGHLPAALSGSFLGDASFDTSGHGHGRYLYHQQSPAASVVSSGCPSSRQGAHQRRHSLPGFESAMLSREAMAASRATAGANLGRLMLQQQQHIRGLPLQSRSERFELRRPSLLEELQQREDEEDWLQGEINPAVAQRRSQRLPWQSRSERFELRRPLPELEELHFRDEEEWLRGESIRKNTADRERGQNFADWSQAETAGTGLQKEASHNHGYVDDWSHSNVLSTSLQAERSHSQNYSEQWPPTEDQSSALQTESSQGQSRSNTYTEDWLHRELNSKLQTENSHIHGQREEWSQGLLGSRLQKEKVPDRGEKKSSYSGAATSSSSSSIWSRSAQWWGSHLPSSTSSAAAAFANTFGLRPASSLAPPVRVRQAVPVCSAPPRRPEASQRTPAPSLISSLNDMPGDGETATRQLFDQLRL